MHTNNNNNNLLLLQPLNQQCIKQLSYYYVMLITVCIFTLHKSTGNVTQSQCTEASYLIHLCQQAQRIL